VTRAALLGLDLGTTSAKALLVDVDSGRPLAFARRPAGRLLVDASGAAEHDAEAWWAAIVAVVREVLAAARAEGPIDVRAISVAGHGPSLVPMRADGAFAGPVITWLDRRAAVDERELAGLIGRSGWLLAELPKARWFLRERAALAAESAWLLSTWDAIAYRLSGEAVTSFWDPARSLDAAQRSSLQSPRGGLDARAMPAEVAPGTLLGGLRPDMADELGLPATAAIVAGLNDGLSAVVGAGLDRAGLAVDVGGTAGGLAIAALPDPAASVVHRLGGALWAGPAPAPFGDLRIVGGAFSGTGAILERTLEALEAQGISMGPAARAGLFAAAAAVPLGADGLLARAAGDPAWRAPGASLDERFTGTRASHTPAHYVRAAIEAGALAVAGLLAPARAAGLRVDEVRLSGPATGASVGTLEGALAGVPAPTAWLAALRADLFACPVVVPRLGETAAAGAAALAGAGVGAYGSLGEAIGALVHPARRVEPGANADAAAQLLDRYRSLVAPRVREDAIGVAGSPTGD